MLHDILDVHLLRYITFRAIMAAVTAFVLGLAAGPVVIAYLKRKKIGDVAKEDSKRLAELSQGKKATPTMGGILIVGAALVATLLFARLDAFHVQLALGTTLSLAALGFVDDRAKLITRGKGTSARTKLRVQALVGLFAGLAIYLHSSGSAVVEAAEFRFAEDEAAISQARGFADLTSLYVPCLKETSLALGAAYIGFAALVVVATCNAVNFTDGLDGLAAGTSIFTLGTFVAFAYVVGRADWSGYLHMPFVPGAGEAAVFGAAMLGATLAFLWWNAHPAEVFMGDTGSLALGGAIASLALTVKQELLLPLAGIIFVIEGLSVVLQVGSFKLTGKRIFRIAPIHHHFQFGGAFETKVTTRFWIVAALAALISLATLKVR